MYKNTRARLTRLECVHYQHSIVLLRGYFHSAASTNFIANVYNSNPTTTFHHSGKSSVDGWIEATISPRRSDSLWLFDLPSSISETSLSSINFISPLRVSILATLASYSSLAVAYCSEFFKFLRRILILSTRVLNFFIERIEFLLGGNRAHSLTRPPGILGRSLNIRFCRLAKVFNFCELLFVLRKKLSKNS